MRRLLSLIVVAATAASLSAQASPIATWRAQHERQIVDELMQLVAIPNVAGTDADMQRNVEHLAGLFKRRGFTVETTTGPGSPVLFATRHPHALHPLRRPAGDRVGMDALQALHPLSLRARR